MLTAAELAEAAEEFDDAAEASGGGWSDARGSGDERNNAVSRRKSDARAPVGPAPASDDTHAPGDEPDAAAADGGWSDVRASGDTANNAPAVRRGESDTPAAAAAPNPETHAASAAPAADTHAASATDKMRAVHGDLGRSVQVEPIKFMLKSPELSA
jgi:hypothetical protein